LAALVLVCTAPAAAWPAARAPRLHLKEAGDPALARVEQGWLRGVREGEAIAFRGVSFATPPVGAKRFAPPAPPAGWSGVRAATAYAPPCPQLDDDGAFLGSEDCLYLNVFRPTAGADSLPVLLFVHGGGHVQGSTSVALPDGQVLYDGGSLAAARHAVVVTVAYRLGALGFLGHAALAAASTDGVAGNYGTRDLIAALEWTRRNIAAFAGDPDRVMVFGESAGAVQTCMLLVSPLAAGLFSSALMQSGGCATYAVGEAEALAGELATNTGCADSADVAACLRALPAEILVRAIPPAVSVVTPGKGWRSTVDGVVIPEAPLERVAAGRHNRVPLVVGANRDETGRSAPPVMTESSYRATVAALVGSPLVADLILARYPSSEYGGSPRRAFVALTSDANFICGARRLARATAAGQDEPVFRYHFTRALENGSPLLLTWGAYHGLELFFVFDKLTAAGYAPAPAETALAAAMQGYWRHLAGAGTPADPALPVWPEYDPVADRTLLLDDPIAAADGVRSEQCDFWDALMP
jgi:para-nitrobenzyl esterase